MWRWPDSVFSKCLTWPVLASFHFSFFFPAHLDQRSLGCNFSASQQIWTLGFNTQPTKYSLLQPNFISLLSRFRINCLNFSANSNFLSVSVLNSKCDKSVLVPLLPLCLQIRLYARPDAISSGAGDYALHITKRLLGFYEDYFKVQYSLPKLGKAGGVALVPRRHLPLHCRERLLFDCI